MQKKIERCFFRVAMVAVCLCGISISRAHEAGSKPKPSVLNVSASSTVKGKPDRAIVSIGVLTQSAKAQEASEKNARQTSAVIAELKKLLGAKGEIKTAYYQLSPNYDHRPGKDAMISGYSASNTVQVTVDDLDIIGKVIDASTQSGANTVQSLQFILKDDSALRKQALQESIAKAKSKADAMAAAAGVKIVRVLSLGEGESFAPRPMFMQAKRMDAMAESTPIEAGDLDISTNVNMVFEIAP